MSVKLITYDLKKPGQDYSDVHKKIDEFSGWARLSESSYAVQTELSPARIFERLKPYLDKNDQLYVIELNRPYFGQGSKDVNDWLEKNLPPA